MTELQPPESYFTIRSFEAARRAGAVAIEHNLEVIADLDEFLKNEGQQGLPGPVENIDFVHYWNGGHSPASWDTHYYDVDIDTPYLPGDQLSQPAYSALCTIKERIMLRSTQIVEIQTTDYTRPLGGALARALIVPEPENAAKKASPGAWVTQAKRALSFRGFLDDFTPGFSDSSHPKLKAEAERRFAHAIVLRRNDSTYT